jgi:hypothetical protein
VAACFEQTKRGAEAPPSGVVVDALLVQGKVNAEAERKPIRSCSERPRRSTAHAMTISNWRRLASLCRASKPGRLSRHLEPRIRGTPRICRAGMSIIQCRCRLAGRTGTGHIIRYGL